MDPKDFNGSTTPILNPIPSEWGRPVEFRGGTCTWEERASDPGYSIANTQAVHPMQHNPGMEETMKEYKSGTLHSGSKTGPKVKSRAQAIAIGMSEMRKK